ncbi:MAG: DUF2800 domain-containing protein [Oscillospiraceae bacterium]|jgi:hypothetical protein|nr:DUF2800 domain-containing protein [Oscillospiraceae bacterium]
MPGEHAKLSASSAHRWLACTASPTLEAQFPDTASPYAAEGTLAHTWAEKAAHARIFAPDNFFDAGNCEGEMLDAALAYADLVVARYRDALTRDRAPTVYLEERVDFATWVPEGFGTADCLIIADGTLEVIDFKYGKGVKVAAADNPQMQLYALGAFYTHDCDVLYDIHTVRMTIFQPRLSDTPDVAEMPIDELRRWAANVLRPKAREAFDGPGQFVPGEKQCRFCRAAAQCRARANEVLSLFDEVERGDLLSDAEVGNLLQRAQIFKAWLDSTADYVEKSLLRGNLVPGWKMVAGRSTRKIADTAAAGKALTDAGFPESTVFRRELETLTNLEKLVGKKRLPELLGELIQKPEGKPTLVPESDKRPALQPNGQMLDAFDE